MNWQRAKDRIVGAVVFVLFDVRVQVSDVEKEGRALAVVQVGEQSVLDEPAQLPLAHTEILSGLPSAD